MAKSVRKQGLYRVRKAAFRAGYRKGKKAGYQKGLFSGIVRKRQDILGRHALLVAATGIPSFEITLQQPFQLIKGQGAFNFTARNEWDVREEMIAAADIVIFQRLVEPSAFPLMQIAKEMGKKTVYVIDDNFLEIPPEGELGAYYREPVRRETFCNFLRSADLVKVDSPYFSDYIKSQFNPNVVYFPGSVDLSLFNGLKKPERNDGSIVIGYEGSAKEKDFSAVIPALLKIMEEYGSKVRIEFHGFIPSSLRDHPQVTHFGHDQDYKGFMRRLYQCTWDFGLAPLEDHLFNRCKTNNKFREYAACHIPGIYTDTPTYSYWVNHGETGFLVPHSVDGWYTGMKRMIEDSDLRKKIDKQANAFAKQHFTVDQCVNNWKQLVLHV